MRIWDVSPGYLSRQRLLGEHRELHGLHSILINGKTGYARHPETLRWVGCEAALVMRHALLVAEMRLRGYQHHSPLPRRRTRLRWPRTFIDHPSQQFALLTAKYAPGESGRIPLPRTPQDLWAQHKYSVMARDPACAREIGRRVARMRRGTALLPLAEDLVLILRAEPSPARLRNALDHMWGHVAGGDPSGARRPAVSPAALLARIAKRAVERREPYLLASTALGELGVFCGRTR